jgi:hypothetical protein
MRLFELEDQGSAELILRNLQGQVNKLDDTSQLPFDSVKKMLEPFDLGVGSPQALQKLFRSIDNKQQIVDRVLDDGTVILKTQKPNQNQEQPIDQGTGPTVDQMASSNAKNLSPKI